MLDQLKQGVMADILGEMLQIKYYPLIHDPQEVLSSERKAFFFSSFFSFFFFSFAFSIFSYCSFVLFLYIALEEDLKL